jgi:Protein of unknown function (DUF3108)
MQPILAHAPAELSHRRARPFSRRAFWLLMLGVLLVHGALLLGMTPALDLRLPTDGLSTAGPLQTRLIEAPASPAAVPVQPNISAPRTRIAAEAAPKPARNPTTANAPLDEPEISTPPVASNTASEPMAAEGSITPTATSSESNSDTNSDTTAPSNPPSTASTAEAPAASATAPAPVAAPRDTFVSATTTLPPIPLGALPPSTLMNYSMTGMSKGLNYYANGALRWQHNASAYAMSLSVTALFLGTRQWKSVGQVSATGLDPVRFSDHWRSERASHFDREKQRVVFSSNAPTAALEPGAQDQISLYLQMAAAMAGDPLRFQPGTRLQIQTATLRDALPWLLSLEGQENLKLDNQTLATLKWVCQPRNRFDAQVTFWMAEKYAWLPVRIKITQTNGDYIDLLFKGQEPLPALAVAAPAS